MAKKITVRMTVAEKIKQLREKIDELEAAGYIIPANIIEEADRIAGLKNPNYTHVDWLQRVSNRRYLKASSYRSIEVGGVYQVNGGYIEGASIKISTSGDTAVSTIKALSNDIDRRLKYVDFKSTTFLMLLQPLLSAADRAGVQLFRGLPNDNTVLRERLKGAKLNTSALNAIRRIRSNELAAYEPDPLKPAQKRKLGDDWVIAQLSALYKTPELSSQGLEAFTQYRQSPAGQQDILLEQNIFGEELDYSQFTFTTEMLNHFKGFAYHFWHSTTVRDIIYPTTRHYLSYKPINMSDETRWNNLKAQLWDAISTDDRAGFIGTMEELWGMFNQQLPTVDKQDAYDTTPKKRGRPVGSKDTTPRTRRSGMKYNK